ncbi:MAG: extracellular solute-binding protein [Oscillospiraceae bacterium]|nr:extracellular solute-binding protein [Oscillospiraceae bacterium]
MKNHKMLSALLAALMLISACLFTVPAMAEDVTEITVWTKDRHDQDLLLSIVDQFNKENPDIHINYEQYTDNYPQVIEIASSAGELPDIFCINNTPMITQAYQRGQLAALDSLITDEDKARFDASLFIEGINMFDGQIYSLPNTGLTLRLVYNQDIFERVGLSGPPKSIDEMVADAKLITEQLGGEGVYGFALPLANPQSGFQRGFNQFPLIDGYPVFEGFDYRQGKYDFTVYKPYVLALADIWNSGAAFPGCESLNIDPLRTQFAAGKIGMYMTYSHSEWGVYMDQFPTDQRWQYAQIPSTSGEIVGSQSLSAGYWYVINSATKDLEKTWRVYSAIYSQENLIKYYEAGYGVSVVPSVIAAATAPSAIAAVPYMGIQPTDKIWPVAPQNVVPEGDNWGARFAEVVFGYNNDIDGIIADLNERYQAAYLQSIEDGFNTQIQYPNLAANDLTNTMN